MPRQMLTLDPKRLFVYGTLRHDIGSSTAAIEGQVVGLGTTPGALFTTGHFPAAIPDSIHRVVGQVLSFEHMDDGQWLDQLRRLDAYEAAPDLFNRRTVDVTLMDGSTVEAQAYFFTDTQRLTRSCDPISSGDWAEEIKWIRPKTM